jgi:hypothetical protein
MESGAELSSKVGRGKVLSGEGSVKEVCSCGRETSCQVKWCLGIVRRKVV